MPAGRAAVVSDYAHSAELPDAIAVRVPWAGDREAALLAALLAELLAEPERLRAMGEAAREHVRRHHDPRRAAAAVADACAEWAAAPPPAAHSAGVYSGGLPPTSLAWGRLGGGREVRGAEPPGAGG